VREQLEDRVLVGSQKERFHGSIFIDPAIRIAPEQIDCLRVLLADLGLRALSVGVEALRRVDIMPDHSVATHINALMAAEAEVALTVMLGPHGPRGVAVPIEGANGLGCHIVLTASLVQAIDPAHPASADLVSTVLEELRHVEHYARAWRRRGYVQPTARHVDRCLTDFYRIANKLLDEYLVNRWKTRLLGTEALIEYAGELTTVAIVYPEPIADVIERSAAGLGRISAAWSRGETDVGPTWDSLTGWLWRSVFEPLTYDAGRRAVFASIDDVLAAPRSSAFYCRHVAPHWEPILAQFERAYANEAETEDALDRIVASLQSVSSAFGVSIRPHDEGCWVEFDERFASWR
jgi:hypothetical protein